MGIAFLSYLLTYVKSTNKCAQNTTVSCVLTGTFHLSFIIQLFKDEQTGYLGYLIWMLKFNSSLMHVHKDNDRCKFGINARRFLYPKKNIKRQHETKQKPFATFTSGCFVTRCRQFTLLINDFRDIITIFSDFRNLLSYCEQFMCGCVRFFREFDYRKLFPFNGKVVKGLGFFLPRIYLKKELFFLTCAWISHNYVKGNFFPATERSSLCFSTDTVYALIPPQ